MLQEDETPTEDKKTKEEQIEERKEINYLNNNDPEVQKATIIHLNKTEDDSVHHLKITRVKALIIMMVLNLTFFFVELIIGYLSNSNSLVADSFHMLSDLISFIVALISIKMSQKLSPNRNTFGWVRAEILGSLINAVFLLALCFSIIIEALERFFEPKPLEHIELILIVGGIGLLINIFGLFIFGLLGGHHLHSHAKKLKKNHHFLSKSHDHKNDEKKKDNMNIRGVFLHVLADALGSVSIIISTLLVKFVPLKEGSKFNWKIYIDPVLSLILAMFIIISAIPLLKESSLILLQTVPKHINLEYLRLEIKKVKGVLDVHHFHVWTLNSNCHIGSLHLKIDDQFDMNFYNQVKDLLHNNSIHSITLQTELASKSTQYDTCVQDDCLKFQCCNYHSKIIKNIQTISPVENKLKI